MPRLTSPSIARRMVGPVAVAVAQGCATLIGAALVHRAAQQPATAPMAALAVFALVCAFGLEVARRRLCEAIGWHEVAQVRAALFRRILRADRSQIARQRHGALLQVFVGDLSARRQWLSDGLPRAVTAPILVAALLAWAAMQSPWLCARIAILLLLGMGVGAGLLRPMSRAVREVRRTRGRLSSFASDTIAEIADGSVPPRQRARMRRLRRRSDDMNRAALRRAWWTGTLRGLPHLLTSLIVLIVLLEGSAISGTVVVIGTAGLALNDLARAAELWIPARISALRIQRLMRLPKAPPQPGTLALVELAEPGPRLRPANRQDCA